MSSAHIERPLAGGLSPMKTQSISGGSLLMKFWTVPGIPLITKRYAGFPIPPHIWHTTLMRSHHKFLPEAVRRVYTANRCNTFATIHLGQPRSRGSNIQLVTDRDNPSRKKRIVTLCYIDQDGLVSCSLCSYFRKPMKKT